MSTQRGLMQTIFSILVLRVNQQHIAVNLHGCRIVFRFQIFGTMIHEFPDAFHTNLVGTQIHATFVCTKCIGFNGLEYRRLTGSDTDHGLLQFQVGFLLKLSCLGHIGIESQGPVEFGKRFSEQIFFVKIDAAPEIRLRLCDVCVQRRCLYFGHTDIR